MNKTLYLWLLCWSSLVWRVLGEGAGPEAGDGDGSGSGSDAERNGEGYCWRGCDIVLGVWNWGFGDVVLGVDSTISSSSLESHPDIHYGIGSGSDLGMGTRDVKREDGKSMRCGNMYRIPSLYLCVREFCTEGERVTGWEGFKERCVREEGVIIPGWESVVGWYFDLDEQGKGKGNREFEGLRVLSVGELREVQMGKEGDGEVLGEVVRLEREVWEVGVRTLEAFDFETWVHNAYGRAMYYFWLVVVLIGVSSRGGRYLSSPTSQRFTQKWMPLPSDDIYTASHSLPDRKTSTLKNLRIFLKRHITVPATFGYTHAQSMGWCTIPTRIQSLTIAAFVGLNVLLCVCSIKEKVFEGMIYWPHPHTQALRYIADRTGILSLFNLPLIFLFGIRNNTLLYLTAWDFSTYTQFHRWVARVATFEAVVHSVLYTVLIFEGHAEVGEAWSWYWSYWHLRYFWNGVLATIFMVAILVVSVYPLRRGWYEVFLALHIVLSVVVLVTMYFHVNIFANYTSYIYPCILIWAFDRALRLLRILFFNPLFWRKVTQAHLSYNPDTNIIRLIVPYHTASSLAKPRPGCLYYVYFLRRWGFWESHPFTVAYATLEDERDGGGREGGEEAMALGRMSPPSPRALPDASTSTYFPESIDPLQISNFDSDIDEEELEIRTPPSSLTFLIRPHAGMTSRLLRSRSALRPSSNFMQRVLIEGPYGCTQPLISFARVLFVVGGSGIAVPLSYLRSLLNSDSGSNLNDDERVRRREVRIVWAVRESAFLRGVLGRELEKAFDAGEMMGNSRLSVRAYLTREGVRDGEAQDEEGDEDDEFENIISGKANSVDIRILKGRPDIFDEVESAVGESDCDEGGEVAVVACGPPRMADDCRRAVVRVLGRRGNVDGRTRVKVEYFEESFGW